MSYVCAYLSVQLDKRRVEKEFTYANVHERLSTQICVISREHGGTRTAIFVVWGSASLTVTFVSTSINSMLQMSQQTFSIDSCQHLKLNLISTIDILAKCGACVWSKRRKGGA